MPEQEQNQQPITEKSRNGKETPEAGQEAREETEALQEARGREAEEGTKPVIGIRTLRGDVSAYMKEKDVSLIDIAAAASRQRHFGEETKETNRTFLMAGGIFLLLAGIAIAGWLLFFRKEPLTDEIKTNAPESLITFEKQEVAVLRSENKEELIGLIQKKFESPISINTILDIPIFLKSQNKKEYLSSSKFLEILEIKPPANFSQSLDGNFTLGIYYLKKNSPFLVFKISSFDLGFSGALNWEKKMANDLKDILLVKNIGLSRQFQDKIIKNRDARILYDADNNPILMYAFINKKYLVIAADADTFEEIMKRAAISQ